MLKSEKGKSGKAAVARPAAAVGKPKLAAPKPAATPAVDPPTPTRGGPSGRSDKTAHPVGSKAGATAPSKVDRDNPPKYGWGVKRPDGSMVPVADVHKGVAVEAAELADRKVAETTHAPSTDIEDAIRLLEKKGYKIVEVEIIERKK